VIEEDEGPDHLPRSERQHTADLEPAEVASTLVDDEFEHVSAPTLRAIARWLSISSSPGGQRVEAAWVTGAREARTGRVHSSRLPPCS
jgi:hypothetical protein